MLTEVEIVAYIDRYGYRSALRAIKPSQIGDEKLRTFWSVAREASEHIDDCLAIARD